jgi:hypothetical protein
MPHAHAITSPNDTRLNPTGVASSARATRVLVENGAASAGEVARLRLRFEAMTAAEDGSA